MKKIRVLLVDDHGVLRAGLRMLINAEPDMTVMGEAANGEEAWSAITRMPPDVAVVDLTLPDTDTPNLIRHIAREYPATRVLVLTMHEDAEYFRTSVGAGAVGFLVKKAADTELISAIRAVHGGRTFVDASLKGEPMRPSGALSPGANPARLSPRELEVLSLLASGVTYEEAARRLSVTPKTVETYRTRLAHKLGIHNRAELVSYALRTGILGNVPPSPAGSG